MIMENHDIVIAHPNGKDKNNRFVNSGVYFYKIKSGKFTSTKKMILLK